MAVVAILICCLSHLSKELAHWLELMEMLTQSRRLASCSSSLPWL